MRTHASGVAAIGFSTKASLPAEAAAMANGSCSGGGVDNDRVDVGRTDEIVIVGGNIAHSARRCGPVPRQGR